MNQNQRTSSILQYWHSVELLSPQDIPKINPNHRDEPVFEVKINAPLPWDKLHLPTLKTPPQNRSRRFTVYCGSFDLSELRTLLEKELGKDNESLDGRNDSQSCVFAFSVTDEGAPILDSFILSSCAWGISQIIKKGLKQSNPLLGFEKEHDRYAALFQSACASSPENKDGHPIPYVDLHYIINSIIDDLGLQDFLGAPIQTRIRCGYTSTKSKELSADNDFLNSFYLKDLKKVSDFAREGEIGAGLATYLNESIDPLTRINIRESAEVQFAQLNPGKFPAARWPSSGHHPLVFSQQIAINTLREDLSKSAGLFAINGPPGTGKTTLLRDLIASVVLDRAEQISKLKNPSDAFEGHGGWKTEGYKRTVSLWKAPFKDFEMVVASSNNGAVENISFEIPGVHSVDPSWLSDNRYFSDIGTLLLGGPAWALIAARLGSKANRSDFKNKFWFDEYCNPGTVKTGAERKGFQSRLKSPDTSVNWLAEVAKFKETALLEADLRAQRQAVYDELLALNTSNKALAVTLKEIARIDLENAELAGESAGIRIQENLAKAHYAEAEENYLWCVNAFPGVIDIILTLGKSYFKWHKEKTKLLKIRYWAKKEVSEHKRVIGDLELKAVKNNAATIKNQKDALKLQAEIEALKKSLSQASQSLGKSIPNLDDWTHDDERELSAPWADVAWNDSRAKLFLAALDLHKAFIEANAEIMRKNLQAAMDLMDGNIPSDTSPIAIRSAWTSLFFVIPVISTTFASFDRLFSALGKESIGWLLIDEAGQATPQAAAGAIWRSKRAVIVGDPLQLEPILKTPFTAQEILRKHFGLSDAWTPGGTSAQQLADRSNRLGTYLKGVNGNIWVGAPLRVHRRCNREIFNISNQIAYDGLMVFGTNSRPITGHLKSQWFDVHSNGNLGHWIPEEGIQAHGLIEHCLKNGTDPEGIFLISPFKAVVHELRQIARRYPGVRVGTIHTTQGKESAVIILVLGGDPKNSGAKAWASEKPNLLNVAASRAKERLYIIGNKPDWNRFNYFNSCIALLAKER